MVQEFYQKRVRRKYLIPWHSTGIRSASIRFDLSWGSPLDALRALSALPDWKGLVRLIFVHYVCTYTCHIALLELIVVFFHLCAVCFLLLHFVVSLLIWSLKLSFNLNTFIKMTWWQYLTDGLQQYALSFTLFWTLFYGLVYLYWCSWTYQKSSAIHLGGDDGTNVWMPSKNRVMTCYSLASLNLVIKKPLLLHASS